MHMSGSKSMNTEESQRVVPVAVGGGHSLKMGVGLTGTLVFVGLVDDGIVMGGALKPLSCMSLA